MKHLTNNICEIRSVLEWEAFGFGQGNYQEKSGRNIQERNELGFNNWFLLLIGISCCLQICICQSAAIYKLSYISFF